MSENFRRVRYINLWPNQVQNFLNEYPEAEIVGWYIPQSRIQVYRYEVTE